MIVTPYYSTKVNARFINIYFYFLKVIATFSFYISYIFILQYFKKTCNSQNKQKNSWILISFVYFAHKQYLF